MKRNILIFLAAFAALLTVSCEKPEPEKKPASLLKSPARITVSVDDALTKTVLGEDGLSVLWDGTESLGVFDGIATAPNKFDAASAGATTSFTGEVSDGAEDFIIFYPYQATATVSDKTTATIQVQIPAVQKAVKNGFDPAAGLAAIQASSLSGAVTLKNQFALLKVNVDQDGVSSITVSATNRKVAGGISLKVSSNGSSNGTDFTPTNSATIKNDDNSDLEQGIYYIAVRPSSTTSPYQGFKMEVVKNGVTKTRTASNNLVVARNHILSIGKVSTLFGNDPVTPVGRYEEYMAGQDITIGGITINKSTHGNATLLTANDALYNISKSSFENGGVVFLKAVGSGLFSNSNNPTISNPLYLIADGDDNVPLVTANYFNLADGSLYMYGIDLTLTAAKDALFIINKNSATSMDYFVMDHCGITQSSKYFLSCNSAYTQYGVRHLILKNNRFAVKSSTTLAFINISSSNSGISVFESLVFDNNYVYSRTGENIVAPIFTYTGTAVTTMTMSVNNNLFYNVVSGGCFKHNTLASASATKNVLWVVDGTDPGANAKLWGMKSKVAIPTVSVTDNIAFGTLATGRKWAIADDTVNTGMDALQVAESNPVATADVTTGTFTMATGYTSYGPQL